MWITTKSIVKEMRKQQGDCERKLELLNDSQKDNTVVFQNQIEALSNRLEKVISEMRTELVSETRNCSNSIVEEIESINCVLRDISEVASSNDALLVNNIETMNHAMQEIIRNIMSLDEGNRLIIAKLLLDYMEI